MPTENEALQQKQNLRDEWLRADAMEADPPRADIEAQGLFDLYRQTPVGEFVSLDAIRLRWLKADWFDYLPQAAQPFGFRRSNGETIFLDRRMFTDGGSIPRGLWGMRGFSPWSYAPAFLVHDWLFDLKHCGLTQMSFEDARDSMMEGVKTLMEQGLAPKITWVFYAIYAGIDSPIARRQWDKPGCTLPPE